VQVCLSRKTTCGTAIRATPGQGVMPYGSSPFSMGKQMVHTTWDARLFSNYYTCCGDLRSPIREDAPFEKGLFTMRLCGVRPASGAGASRPPRSSPARTWWCLLAALVCNSSQGARLVGANKIIGVMSNSAPQALRNASG